VEPFLIVGIVVLVLWLAVCMFATWQPSTGNWAEDLGSGMKMIGIIAAASVITVIALAIDMLAWAVFGG
jgi:hypothetical protein